MKKFLETCTDFGVDKISERAPMLKASIPAMLYESLLFFICGYDFIFDANDTKFRGIVDLFVTRGGTFEMNLGPNCLGQFNAMLSNPSISTTIEGTNVRIHSRMGIAGGVQPGGVGNYNLQTQALELLVTSADGLDRQSMLQGMAEQLKAALAKPASPLNNVGMATMGEMRQSLTPYWGDGIRKLGVS